MPFCQCNIVEACFDIYKISSAAHKINDEMIDCIAPAAHAFELAVKWIWPPGAEPVQPQEIHVLSVIFSVALGFSKFYVFDYWFSKLYTAYA